MNTCTCAGNSVDGHEPFCGLTEPPVKIVPVRTESGRIYYAVERYGQTLDIFSKLSTAEQYAVDCGAGPV